LQDSAAIFAIFRQLLQTFNELVSIKATTMMIWPRQRSAGVLYEKNTLISCKEKIKD